MQATQNQDIRFKAKLAVAGSWVIVRVPKDESAKLPSRGMTVVEGTINGIHVQTPLEPDGAWSHWFKIDDTLAKAIKSKAGDTVTIQIRPMSMWPRPDLPQDLQSALARNPEANALWASITPNAQWEWIRWIRATNQAETRKRRIEVACSKLKSGMRRPCCFNRNMCTEPSVSKNGVLLETK